MRRIRLRLPSPALVVASIAVLLAMAGTGYAAFKVGTKNIKNGAVTTNKIKNGAVTNKKIKNGAVTASKINTTGLTVPNALHANSANTATTASTASTVGGNSVTKISDIMTEGEATTTFFNADGLTLTESCNTSAENNIGFSTSSESVELNASGDDSGTFFESENDGVTAPGGSIFTPNSQNEGSMTMSYGTETGQVVTFNLGYDYPGAYGANNNLCGVYGTATTSSGASELGIRAGRRWLPGP